MPVNRPAKIVMPYILNGAQEIAARGQEAVTDLCRKYPGVVAARGDLARLFYLFQREDGVDHEWAVMTANQQAGRANSDRELFEGVGTLAKQFEGNEAQLNELVSAAKEQGYTPGIHDMYVPGLAANFGDPMAFVPPTGGRNHIRRVCEDRNWTCLGSVETTGRELENPIQPIPIGEDIVQRKIQEAIAIDPGLAERPAQELREMVVERHSFHDSKLSGESLINPAAIQSLGANVSTSSMN